jgi:phospholipid/cholesterol/gamma-HCH transport system substrate-binding protein
VKTSETREIIVGACALLLLAVVIGSFYARNRMIDGRAAEGYRLSAAFNRIDGVGVGTPVYVSGIPVGRIEAMSLNANFQARITMTIDEGVRLPADTAASIHTDGLFGSKFVALEPGGDERILQDGGVIAYTQDSVVVTELLDLIIAEGKAQRAGDQTGPKKEH